MYGNYSTVIGEKALQLRVQKMQMQKNVLTLANRNYLWRLIPKVYMVDSLGKLGDILPQGFTLYRFNFTVGYWEFYYDGEWNLTEKTTIDPRGYAWFCRVAERTY